LFNACADHNPHPHSFPTRRSSDLDITSGQVLFKNKDLLKMSKQELRKIRGNDISMIFQEPSSSLNPVLKIGDQITEGIRTHQNRSEEHTSELQSRFDLVCRLLLEK